MFLLKIQFGLWLHCVHLSSSFDHSLRGASSSNEPGKIITGSRSQPGSLSAEELFDQKTDANTFAEGDHLLRQPSQPAVPADHMTECRLLWIILGCDMRQQGYIINGGYKDMTLGLLNLSVLYPVGCTSGGRALGGCPSVRWVPMGWTRTNFAQIWDWRRMACPLDNVQVRS